MFNKIQRILRNRKGFTLVELIVVVAILGILAAVAVPKFGGVTTNAKEKADKATLREINNAIQIYCLENEKDDFAGASHGSNTIADDDGVDEVIAVLKGLDLIDSGVKIQGKGTYKYDKDKNVVE